MRQVKEKVGGSQKLASCLDRKEVWNKGKVNGYDVDAEELLLEELKKIKSEKYSSWLD